MARVNKTVIRLAEIDPATETQIRVTMNIDQIEHYAERMEEGDSFPPVKIFQIGSKYILADGFHRVAAAKQLGLKQISCDIHDDVDALDIATAAIKGNTIHGLPMTKQDRVKAINLFDRLTIVRHGKVAASREVAELVGCSHTTVVGVRKQRESSPHYDPGEETGLERLAKVNAGDAEPVETVVIEPREDNLGDELSIGMEYSKQSLVMVRALRKTMKDFAGVKAGVMIGGHMNVLDRLLDDISAIVQGCTPVNVCDLCKGEGCQDCKQSGILYAEQAKAMERDVEVRGGGK